MKSTPRRRVLMAINHEEPDRIPIIIGTSNTTSMKQLPYQKRKALLGIQAEDRFIYDWPGFRTVLPDEATLARLHSDTRGA